MKAEHCSKAGFDLEFTTPNYHFVTTASQEWRIVVEGAACQQQNMGHGRVMKDLTELCELGQKQGNLGREEVIAVVLYTGPMVIFVFHGFIMKRITKQEQYPFGVCPYKCVFHSTTSMEPSYVDFQLMYSPRSCKAETSFPLPSTC